jgi:hypothetical protein
MITSYVERASCDTDCHLLDWREAGLSKPSAVRCRPATIRVEKINAVIGSLTDRIGNAFRSACAARLTCELGSRSSK